MYSVKASASSERSRPRARSSPGSAAAAASCTASKLRAAWSERLRDFSMPLCCLMERRQIVLLPCLCTGL